VKRDALLDALQDRLAHRESGWLSFRALAEEAGVSVATLRHYFGSRDALIAAILDRSFVQGAGHIAHVERPIGAFAASIDEAVAYMLAGLRFGLAPLHAVGLAEGMAHPTLGPTYLSTLLDPSIDALAKRLDAHVAAGEADIPQTRLAAIALVAPLVLAALHQGPLGGNASPIDLADLGRYVSAAFVRAHCVAPRHE
jgi:AcrR family transcriptional regulator